ncbi:MAG: winged helix DNA-binding domain-containing protein [Gemmatimonadota bacterium]
MYRITVDERRARLGLRHHLTPANRVGSVTQVARDMVCLHATDPATVYLSAWARLKKPQITQIDKALYVDKTLVRMLAMRRTLFVIPTEDAPLFHAATLAALTRIERHRAHRLVTMLGVARPGPWLARAKSAALAALERLGEATAQELARKVPALQRKVRVNEGKQYAGDIGMSGRVLLLLALEGKVVRGRPRGTWVSSQHRWAPMTGWLGRPMPKVPLDDARAGVVQRWLARFGPGTEADIRWWTGWTAGGVRQALATLKAVAVDLDGETGYLLPGDLKPTKQPKPWVALLPSLDPTTMGWQARDWYLGNHKRHLFDNNGNAGPTIWADGRIVGGWAIRAKGEVVTRLLEDIGRERTGMVAAEAARLAEWLDPAPVMPRFPTPLHKEMVK